MNTPKEKEQFERIATIKYKWIETAVLKHSNAKFTIILCPGFPESTQINKEIMEYLSEKYEVSCVYPQYLWTWNSDWSFLEKSPSEDIQNIVEAIRAWKLWVNEKSSIVLLWSSFWGGVALSQSWNSNIDKVIALSPLTWESDQVNWESLLTYMKEYRSKDYRINEEWYKRLATKNLLTIPKKYPEGKVIIGGVEDDPEINYKNLTKESLKKHASVLKKIDLWDEKKKHLSWNVINRMHSWAKEELFSALNQLKMKRFFISEFINQVVNLIPEERITGILGHGSRVFKQQSNHRDLDFILVLDSPSRQDSLVLQNLKQHFHKLWVADLDITLVYKTNIEKGGLEKQGYSTHGSYYNTILAEAECFYGNNIFKEKLQELWNYQQGFSQEIWKYTDRLNRSISTEIDPYFYRKYIKRMLLSLGLSKGIITPHKSNFFSDQDLNKILKILSDDELIEQLPILLEKKERGKEDIQNLFYLYNKIYTLSLENNIKVKNTHMTSILSTICSINDNIIVSCGNVEYIIQDPNIKFISCGAFKQWSFDELDDTEKLNSNQINNLAQINVIVQQIQKYFKNTYWKGCPTSAYFGDYGVRVKNPELLESQFAINKKYCTKIFNNDINYSNLSGEFAKYPEFKKMSLESVASFLQKLNLSKEFIEGYLYPYHNKDPKELEMILWSIMEHALLINNMLEKWENSIIIYIGNSQKITLMNEILKSKSHSNIFIWIMK